MKARGGYQVQLKGKPSLAVEVLPEQGTLFLPLKSRRFTFSALCVEEGARVHAGQILAKDPQNYSVPLLAPRAGNVRLGAAEGHIVLEDVAALGEEPEHPLEQDLHIPKEMGSVGMKRYKLLMLGAWEFLQDAHTGDLPDPFGTPRAVVVSTVDREPFVARGDVQMHKRLNAFTRGLEQLQSLLEYQPIYVVMPESESEFALRLRDLLRGYVWVQVVPIPLRYGPDRTAVVARRLGLKPQAGQPVWSLGVQGVLAIDRALTLSRPCDVRIVSVGGPAVKAPAHLRAFPGYPLSTILDSRGVCAPARVINGGAFTGRPVGAQQIGLDVECTGLTVLPEHRERELLGFARPHWNRRSYSKCFLSALRPAFEERFTTALRGELRACVSCGLCEEVCPARIVPYLIHKRLYADAVEEAEAAGLHMCVRCGLCSFVCPSKIELREQFVEAQEMIRIELQTEKAQA